jgi:hypothetical protein
MWSILLALPFIAPSIALNAACQFSHEHEPLVLWGSVALSAGAVLVVAYLPLAIMRAPNWGSRFMLSAGFVFLLSFNLASGIGAVSTSRSDLTGSRRADNARLSLLTGQLSQVEASRKALAATAGEKTAVMVDAELTALRQDARWSRSKGCADATLTDSRTFCAEYAQKQGARDAAAKVGELDASIATLRAQLGTAQTATAGESEDPQAEAVAMALGALWTRPDLHTVGVGASVQKAMAAEILPAIATTAIAILFSSSKPVQLAPSAPRPSLRKRTFLMRHRRGKRVAQSGPKLEPVTAEPVAQGVNEPPQAGHVGPLAGHPVGHLGPPANNLKNTDNSNILIFADAARANALGHVMELVAQGVAQRTIAKRLGLSRTTVQRLIAEARQSREAPSQDA